MNSENNKQKILSVLPLFIITLVCFITITVSHYLSKDKIKENKTRAALAVINEVIPAEYDNDLLTDKITVTVPKNINPTGILTAYRARHNDTPVAVSLMPIITKGYNGNISLVIGIRYDGSVSGIRVLHENETEGFGNKVHQEHSDWILGFDGTNTHTTKEKDWAVKKDGGKFDQLTGATITSRSIIRIIYKTLEFYAEHRDTFYEDQ